MSNIFVLFNSENTTVHCLLVHVSSGPINNIKIYSTTFDFKNVREG